MNKEIDLEMLSIKAEKENLIDLSRALPELRKMKLGIIKTSRVMKYLKRFKKLIQIEVLLLRNHYFSGDRVFIDFVKIRNGGATGKGIVQFLNNFRGLKGLSLCHFRLTNDLLKAINRHKKTLKKLVLVNCTENIKREDDHYLYDLPQLKILKIIRLTGKNTHTTLGTFESRYLGTMPHDLQTFEIDNMPIRINVERMKIIPNITLQFYPANLDEHQEHIVEFINKLNRPIILRQQTPPSEYEENRIRMRNFIEEIHALSPLTKFTIAKHKRT